MPGPDDYLHFSAEEFAQDEHFVRWVLTPDAATEAFWQQWLTTYPFQRDEVELARHMLLALHQLPQVRLTTDEKQDLKQRIFTEIEAQQLPALPVTQQRRRGLWYWGAAAALVFALLGGWQLWQTRQAGAASYESLLAAAQQVQALKEVTNTSATLHLVNLPDGSSVLLRPHSRLAFPAQFTGRNRTVYLKGDAFFEVAKNPERPFFVTTAHVVTKVLGTSFEVQAQPEAPNVVVTVKTGRVSVYPRESEQAQLATQTRKLEGFVLAPNQQATYRLKDQKLLRSLVPQPALQPGTPRAVAFDYVDTPIRKVFADIEQAYNVDIVYDEATLSNCPITASLNDEPLFEKLNLLCKAVRANYEVLDTQIVVTGSGCQ
ncbi:FecR family protein [Hymenobacter sp. BT186]|uniref:FecR family protein n=1 Tax=Hymenobacter telluris TaxID=2816474 RepID=A0A939JFL6_9BACT|nr:FecR family protein [Hymenobacter telluris]MBO0360552.1 FecR family protein [Hymenobacter telluris]MBW3376579.1 FecR family protein [Hymenobacter norwichensis]